MKSYSNYGEDAILRGILKRLEIDIAKEDWSYIDLGAWKPISDSNTFFLYKMGLCGTAVEPNAQLRIFWEACRPKDTFLNVACSSGEEKSAVFYKFGVAGQSSTLDRKFADTIALRNPDIIRYEIEVTNWNLERIIAHHRREHSGKFILDIDIEGLDFEVIKSYDFLTNPRPSIILIESFEEIGVLKEGKIETFMESIGYIKVGSSVLTHFYLDYRDLSLKEKIRNALLH